MFQERYSESCVTYDHSETLILLLFRLLVETVICRLYYEARCPSGKMTMVQFRRSNFVQMIHSLGPNVDLNSVSIVFLLLFLWYSHDPYLFQTRDCFSYKHFYVLYCKFWTLDDDHDLIISEEDLAKYNQGALAPSAIQRIMQCGRIAAFARDPGASSSPPTISCEATMEEDQVHQQSTITLTYLDYICKYYYCMNHVLTNMADLVLSSRVLAVRSWQSNTYGYWVLVGIIGTCDQDNLDWLKDVTMSGFDAWTRMVMVYFQHMNWSNSGENRKQGNVYNVNIWCRGDLLIMPKMLDNASLGYLRMTKSNSKTYCVKCRLCMCYVPYAREKKTQWSILLRNDLIQPRVRGQFRLQDLKRNGFLAERFFDTFLNFDRFQIHESYQGSIRAKRKEEMERRQRIHDGELIEESLLPIFDDSLGFFMIR